MTKVRFRFLVVLSNCQTDHKILTILSQETLPKQCSRFVNRCGKKPGKQRSDRYWWWVTIFYIFCVFSSDNVFYTLIYLSCFHFHRDNNNTFFILPFNSEDKRNLPRKLCLKINYRKMCSNLYQNYIQF